MGEERSGRGGNRSATGLVGARVRTRSVAMLAFTAASLTACSSAAHVNCTAGVGPTITVLVVDSQGRAVCDATVVARDGVFSERLRSAPATEATACRHAGLSDAGGTYDIDVDRGARHTELHG